jgi:tetratricopeptide (TPR) repeat protein
MMRRFLILAFFFPALVVAQEMHDHPAPEKLGTVSFPTSCRPETQPEFNRAVALLHSFAYGTAEEAFKSVAAQDPQCAMAHWGVAMTHFHELWDPHLPADGIAVGQKEIAQAEALPAGTERERGFIHALSLIYKDAATVPYSTRAVNYEGAMRAVALANPKDTEAQVFYALALLSNASPMDKTHAKQKQAAGILEPLFQEFPDHPGIPHYLIHACDSQELAQRGLPAARVYAKIAPSASHALHMPSHIFTRLGLWDDSIAANVASKDAAEKHGETGDELHAMDYLVYAYLQSGRDQDAVQVIEQLKTMESSGLGENLKFGYAATAMPVRYVVERHEWSDAEKIVAPPDSALPHVRAIAVWARGMGLARNGHPQEARKEAETLGQLEERLKAAGNDYWASQVNIQKREVLAWAAEAEKKPEEAVAILRSAADDEDGIEKLPVTPGPIVPAREQLGELLLEQGNPAAAHRAFETALVNAPGRRGALLGAAKAARDSAQK